MLKRITTSDRSGGAPTLRDVAELVGVSQATVSYVLNSKENARISEETRRRVLAAAAELQYRPNAIARAMAVGRSRTIGVYQPHVVEFPLSGMWAAQVTRGIGETLHDHGYHMLVYGYRETEDPCPTDFLDGRIDALIVLAPHIDDTLPRALAGYGFAVAVVGGRAVEGDNAVCIDVDNVLGARLAVEHLIGLGHSRIAHLSGPHGVPNAADRAAGYRQAMLDAGRGPQICVVGGGFSETDGFRAAGLALELRPTPTALFVANDVAALGALRACRERGMDVPGDVAVVGYDDAPFAALAAPPLTTVAQPAAALGRAAAESMVAHRTDQRPAGGVRLFAPELAVRESCGAGTRGQGR